jgi:hypothetical protein
MSSDTVTAVPATPRARASSLADWIAKAWFAAKRFYLFLLPLRFSFLALIVVAFAFLISAQGYDIIANLAEDDPTGATPSHDGQRIGFIVGVVFLALQTWYWSRQLLHVKPPEGKPKASDYPWLTTWLPRILGALAFVIAIACLWRVARNYGVPQPVSELRKMAIYLTILLIAFLAFTILRRRFLREDTGMVRDFKDMQWPTRILLMITVALSLALFLWSTFAVQSTVVIGSAAVVILAFALSVPIGSVLVWLGIKGGVPILTFLLIWAVLISPLADNHVVETLPGDVSARSTVPQAFDAWFDRLQKENPPGPDDKYPVIVVATEGGGIRAAYWTAAVLTSLTDTLPKFSDHVFAISAVSGGALGATVYDALLVRRGDYALRLDELEYTPQAQETRALRLAAKEMLSQDALAPTLAAMTQPDLAQRFVPVPIFPDRARALEGGWERAWRTTIARNGEPDDLFAGGFLQMMKGREARIPSLFLNGTIVETGQRIIASNLRIDGTHGSADELAKAVDLFGAIGADVRVSTAVDNSARFTYVAPAGTLRRAKDSNGGSPVACAPGESCEHVVDGGYFENSGSATISDVLGHIRRSKHAERIRPHVIFIQFRMEEPAPSVSVRIANEVLSPVRALLAVRGAHADLATEELKDEIGDDNHTTFELVQHVDKATKKPIAVFPLGWLLADRTRNLMDAQMGPKSKENGANVARIARLLGEPAIRRDQIQELAAQGEVKPEFQE